MICGLGLTCNCDPFPFANKNKFWRNFVLYLEVMRGSIPHHLVH